MELNELRKEIDTIDDALLCLFVQRMALSAKVADYKKEKNLPVYHPGREQEILTVVAEKAGPEMAEYAKALYARIFDLSREYQRRRLFTPKCGLLGRSLAHSYSPQIHSMLGCYPYTLFEREPEALEEFLREGDFTGINVTIPYKKAVIPYLQELTPAAKKIGAVNTIVQRPDGSLAGHNTDYYGFSSMVRRSGLEVAGKKVLVLGSGGASNTAVTVLEEIGANVIVISRSGNNNYQNIGQHADCAILVNTTPVGMYPDTGVAPVDLGLFPNLEGVLDVIYNPARTKLVLDAEKRGIPVMNGLWMLIAQAKEAAEYFTGTPIEDSVLENIHRKLSRQMQNIVLIGMPGSGKSTVGRILAELTGRKYVDADEKIMIDTGMSIPEIFHVYGEDGFRQREIQVLDTLGKQSGLILSTGGGCVTREENYSSLKQNGTIFWLQRELDKLPTKGRPLSQTNNLTQLYNQRKNHYQDFADFIVDNNTAPEEAAAAILRIMEETP